MKKFLLAFALLLGATSFYNTVEAQSINISINIGRQPAWGPVGYDYVGYYYFPDIDCYYDVNVGMFYYMDRGRWISARYLPYAYRHYDLYGLYKVVLNVNQPWRYHSAHYRDYARYRGHRNQVVIRDSRDNRYHASRNNRVSWYSNDRSNNYRGDNRYNNGRTNNNYSNNYKSNDSRRDNNNYRPDNQKNYRQDNNKNNNSYRSDKSNSRADNNKNKNVRQERSRSNSNSSYSSPKSSSRERSGNNQSGSRSSSAKSSDYRLASSSGRTR